jgi:hypothetical protein
LIVALLVVAVMAVAVLLVFRHLQLRTSAVRLDERQIHLVALTDAAMAETMAGLSAGRSFGGVRPRGFDGGEISSTVTSSGRHTVAVQAIGRSRGWRGVLSARVVLEEDGPRIVSWSRRQGPDPDGTSDGSSRID